MKQYKSRDKFSSYVVQKVEPETIVGCPRCCHNMKFIRCVRNKDLDWLIKNYSWFDYVYKCHRCNLWQHHWSSKWRESLNPIKK